MAGTSSALGRPSPAEARRAKLVWVIAVLGLVTVAFLSAWTIVSDLRGRSVLAVLTQITYGASLMAFVISGAMIVSRQPRNVIGWLLMVPGIPLGEIAFRWLASLDPVPSEVDTWLWLTVWFTSWSWVILIFPVLHLLLTFPTGRFLTRRWRWAGWLEVAMILTLLVFAALSQKLQLMQDESTLWAIDNPIGFIPPAVSDAVFGVAWNSALFLLAVTCVAAVAVRFRRGSSVERQQLKWLLGAVALFGTIFAVGAASSGVIAGGVGDLMFGLSIGAIPVAVAVAVLRYRLYEIDRIVSRTVAYGLLIGALAGLFYATVAVLAVVLPASGDLAVAGSTLLVAAAFNPLRRGVHDMVDRRFNRARFDAARVLDRFSETLRVDTGSDDVIVAWLAAVTQTMQPVAVSLWLKPPSPATTQVAGTRRSN